jgi:hypothetical protein
MYVDSGACVGRGRCIIVIIINNMLGIINVLYKYITIIYIYIYILLLLLYLI